MSEAQGTTVAPATAAAPVAQATAATIAPAKPKNAIQLVESQIADFFKQKEQLVANLHAVDGAIQGAQKLLVLLRAEAAKAVAEAEKLAKEAAVEAKHVAIEVKDASEIFAKEVETKAETVESKVVDFVKKEL